MKTLCLSFCALAVTAPALLAYPFTPPQTVRASFGRVAGVADFNRDGRADILMASDHELVWMRNNGGASFSQAAVITISAPTIRSIQTPDIDGDGDPDVVFSTGSPSQLLIYRNDGSFTFSKRLEVAAGNTAVDPGVIIGDYDFDGDLDAGVYFRVNGNAQMLLGWARNDDGVFSLQSSVAVGANSWSTGLAADFNRDERVDTVLAESSAFIDFGNTPLSPQNEWVQLIASRLTSMESGDINGDGYPDLVVAAGPLATDAQSTAWFQWTSTGFSAAKPIQSRSSGRTRATHLMDVDEDGDLDAVFNDQAYYVNTSTQAPQQIVWAENDGGNLLAAKLLLDNTEAWVIKSGDVDGDGDADLVWSENGDVMLAINSAIHRTAEFGDVPVAAAPSLIGGIAAGKVTGGAQDDFVYSIPGTGTVIAYTGFADGEDPPYVSSPRYVTSAVPGATAVAAGDLNHDGKSEVVIVSPTDTVMRIARLTTSGTWVLSTWGGIPLGARDVAIADMDDDNHPDIVIGHDHGITIMRNHDGDSTGWLEETVLSHMGPFTKVCPVQLNGAGRMELFAMQLESSPARCRIYRILWSGSAWGLAQVYDGDAASSLLTVGDVNRDCSPDVIYSVNGTVTCVTSIPGTNSLGATISIAGLPPGLRCAGMGDFNRDGMTDFVAAGGAFAYLALGKGDGSFAAPAQIFYDSSALVSRMTVLDFDRDGDLDIIVVDDATNRIRVLYNGCGQYDLKEVSLPTAPGNLIPALPSSSPLVMRLEFTHAGRTGDAAANLRSLRFRLRKAAGSNSEFFPGAGLTTAEATSLISGVDVYADMGELLNFESGTDPLIGTVGPATADGRLTVTPTAGSQGLLTPGAGQTLRLWVRVRMAANANASTIHRFFIEHISDPAYGGSLFVHAGLTSNFRLDPMNIENAATMLVVPGPLENWRKTNWNQYDSSGPAANDADPDGDGVPNLVEYLTGTNPKAAERELNAFLGLTVLPINSAQLLNLRVFADNNALATPGLRVGIEESYDLNQWNNFATHSTGSWTGVSHASIPAGTRTNHFFGPFTTPQIYRKSFYRLKVVEE